MFSCPFCNNFTYEWNDKDTAEVKEATIKLVQDHMKENHPEAVTMTSNEVPTPSEIHNSK
jgi:pyruvate-formate lyase-activating enzyme